MISLHLLQMCFYMRKKSIFSILCILFFQFFYSNNIFKDSTLLKNSSDYIKYHPSSKEDFFQEYLGKGNKYKLPSEDKERGKAIGAFEELDQSGNYAYSINPNELTTLPVGLRENKGNVEYSIVVTKAKFTPEYALINVYARVITPQKGIDGGRQKLYFGAENIKLSYNGKIIGDAKLSLLGDIHIPFNKNKWLLTLEGGHINKESGESINDNTYVIIDCDGIKELALKGNVQISRDILSPVEQNGKLLPLPNRVRGDFAIKASDWNDLLVKVSITPFAITSQTQHKDKGYFTFYASEAILDLSDLRNDPDVIFPQYYATQGYLIAGAESWRGLYVRALEVGLPQEIKTSDKINSRVRLAAQNLIIDNYGVSGRFSAENLFPLEKGITSKENAWRYSLDKIGVDLAASKIVGANLSGKIQLPIQKKTTDENSKIPQYLGYTGQITEEEYLISVNTVDDIDFNIWSAKATIAKGSAVELRVVNQEFLPRAILNGELTVAANTSPNDQDAKKDAHFKGIKFEGLVLQTKAPFLTAKSFGVEGEQRLGGFPVSIGNIVISADANRADLGFEIHVGLQENKFSASGGLIIHGAITSSDHRQKWEYNGFTLSKLSLRNVDVGVAKLNGYLHLMKKDPLYGNGFNASLEAEIAALQGAKISVNAAFGYSTFRYWGFEGKVDNLNVPIMGGIKITGFTGGAFYRMIPDKEKTILPGYENMAIVLKPDENVGLALRAGVYGAVQNNSVASFMAGFNVSTNKNGGLSQIGFIGEAVIMSNITALAPQPFAKLQENFKGMVSKSSFLQSLKDHKLKAVLDISDVEEQYPLSASVPSTIYGKLAMNYDFNNNIFHANLDVNINGAGGVIRGVGPNGKAGWAVLHIAPTEWYLHIGNPTDMIGLKVGFGKFYLEAKSYFMVGNRIPGSPPPPAEVANILGISLDEADYMKNLNALGEGKGFAFGAHLNFDTGDMTALILYARFQAGLGADIMLKNYGDARCSNRGGSHIGIDGWYANGQAYAYLQGELGIKIKLWFIKKKIPIIKAGVAALLQARGPNPFWVRGYLGGYYNLLGGLIKGRFRFKLEFGEECKLEKASVLGGMKIITDLTPRNNDKNIDVFAIPQATFAMRVNEPIVIPEDDGDHTYKIILEKMTIVDESGKEIIGNIEYTSSKDGANFISTDILPPNKTLKAIAQVSFMEKKGGIYETIMLDGKKATETEERVFTTGTAPSSIPLSNIQYGYPVVEQHNFYTKESNKGYIKLKRGQDYLFDDPSWKTISKFAAEKPIENDFSYDNNANTIHFSIPKLDKEKDYTFALIAKNTKGEATNNETLIETRKTEESEEESAISVTTETKKAQNLSKNGEIERLSFTFRTSRHYTFLDKLKSLKFRPMWGRISSDLVFLQNNMNADEYFDIVELQGTKYTDGKPLVEVAALMDDSFAQKFKMLFYDEYPLDQIVLSRTDDEKDFAGIPPVKAMPIFNSYITFLNSGEGNALLKNTFPYQYDLFRYYKIDWYELVSKAANKYIDTSAEARPVKINRLLESNFGVIPKQKYRAKIKYILPGQTSGAEKIIEYELK